jgi:23S rRNA (adenine2503-C2)-methyltransferase
VEVVGKIISASEKSRLYRLKLVDNITVKTIAHLTDNRAAVTISASTTVGCPLTCKFCDIRNVAYRPLSADLIVAQVEEVAQDCNQASVTAIRFDVSGEPLLNWKAVAGAVRKLSLRYNQPAILISSAAPRFKRHQEVYDEVCELGREFTNLSLQFSVHASSQEKRQDRFQDANLLSLTEIANLGQLWIDATGRRCSFNYAIDGLNNGAGDATALSQMFPPQVWEAQITPTYADNPPRAFATAQLERFKAALATAGYTVTIYFPDDALTIGAVPGLI